MLFLPKKLKYRKYFRAHTFLRISSNIVFPRLRQGSLGLKAIASGFLALVHVRLLKQTLHKRLKGVGLGILFCTIDAIKTIRNKKSPGVRMGKGKGLEKEWFCRVRSGMILCEIDTKIVSRGAHVLLFLQNRLPIKTVIIFF